jgi:hypothetical protein
MATNDPVIEDFEQSLKPDRKNWEALWQDIAELVMPRRDFSVKRSKGSKRHNRVFDSTALWAAGQLAAGLESFLVNPKSKWFNLRLPEGEEVEDDAVKEWLSQVRDKMLKVFNSPESNFYPAAHEMFLDLSAFGTGSIYADDTTKGIRFQARPLSEAYVKEGSDGRVDTYFREYEMTTRQAKQFFGEEALRKASRKLRKELDDGKTSEKHDFLQAVYPSGDFDPQRRKTRNNKPWKSVHILMEGDHPRISERGYDQFPFIVARWSKVSGETYGRSPAMEVLPDIKMLQEMTKTTIKAAQKVVDPPLLVPDDGFLGPIRTMPAGLNYYRSGSQDTIEPLQTNGRVDIGSEMIEQRQQVVLRAFYVQALQGILQRGDSSPLKATEVVARQQQALRAMAPVVSRLQAEFLVPLVDRVFALMLKRGEFDDPPNALQGKEMQVEFISPAATAQQSAEADNVMNWLQQVFPVLEMDPQGTANIDTDKIIRGLGEMNNVPPEFIVSQEETQAAREENAQLERARQVLELRRQQGEAAGTLNEAAQTLQEVGANGNR